MKFVRWGPLVGADIRDTGEVVAAIKRYGVTSVVHFASLIAVGESVRDPALYYDVNVAGTLSLLRAMRQTGVQRIVFSSSAAVYGCRKPPAQRGACAQPGEPVWMVQIHGGAHVAGSRGRLRPALLGPALFQCLRRRCGG